MASGYYREEVAPGGCSHAVLLHLNYRSASPSTSQSLFLHRGQLVSQLVTAHDDVVRIYDIYRRPTDAPSTSSSADLSTHRIVLVREHHLFGVVTGLQRVQTLQTDQDGRDRLLISFKDAKIGLLEWSDALEDLEIVSIHTYERAPQLSNGIPHLFQPVLNVDPLSRCAALLLPQNAMAILPFYRDAADFDLGDDLQAEGMDTSMAAMDSLPYSPSFILTMQEVDPKIKSLKDFCFLPGFQKPTVAILFSDLPTWTGLLAERKDNFFIYVFTLDLSASIDGPAAAAAAATMGGVPFDDGSFRTAHPVVTTSSNLPFDCLYMISCPQALGGVLVVCMSSIVHIDQSGRVIITALTDWFKTVSSLEAESHLNIDGLTDLQNSQLAFTSDTEGILTLSNGDSYTFRCQMDGRSMEGIRLQRMDEATMLEDEAGLAPAAGAPSSCMALLQDRVQYLFNASMAGSSTLYELVQTKRVVNGNRLQHDDDGKEANKQTEIERVDMDLDDDLYGSSSAAEGGPSKTNGVKAQDTYLTLQKAAELRSHGGFLSMARRLLPSDEAGTSRRYGLVACSGSGSQAGLAYLDPRFTPSNRVKIAKSNEEDSPSSELDALEDVSKAFTLGVDNDGLAILLCTLTGSDQSVFVRCDKDGEYQDQVAIPQKTLFAGPLHGGKIGRITSAGLQVLSENFGVVHEINLSGKNGAGPQILEGRIEIQEFAILHTSDGETLIYRLDDQGAEFESLDLSKALGERQMVSVNAFRDLHGQLKMTQDKQAANEDTASGSGARKQAFKSVEDDEEVDYGEEEVTEEVDATQQTRSPVHREQAYLFALDDDGVCEILRLPDLQVVWKSHALAAQPQRLRFEDTRQAVLHPEQEAVVTNAMACYIGDVLNIVSLTADSFLTVYQWNPWRPNDAEAKATHPPVSTDDGRHHLSALGFNKTFVSVLVQPAGARAFDADGHSSRVRPSSVQMQTLSLPGSLNQSECNDDALVLLGAGRETSVSVLFAAEQGGYRLLDWPNGDAVSLASFSPATSGLDLVYCDKAGTVWAASVPSGLHDGCNWISSMVKTGREYTKVVAHDPTFSVVAASVNPCQFVLFDEEGEQIQEPAQDPTPVYSQRGALELFIDEDRQTPVDGYEFEANETVTALEVVHLDAPSTVSGRKQFIAAGTTTFHGEDRTAKGSIYLFEVIEVVSSRYQIGKDLRLKLVCRDDSRAPVTAIADINGFLVNTSGQKLYVRALEKEEWLISVAFLDCPYYITSIRIVKNFMLLSDLKKSLWFIAFQEEPYRFVTLGRDINDQHATMGHFLVKDDKVSLVSTSGEALGGITGLSSEAGVIRLFEYAPNIPSSLGGQRLLVRTEFQTSSEAVASTFCRGRWLSDSELRGREEGRNKLMFAKSNGALESLAAADDKVAKRFHLLQGQLVRSVQHFAGLNPRGFRTVRNDLVSRPLSKGILDGRLLDSFLYLSRPKMLEAVRTLAGSFDGLDQVKESKPAQTQARPEDDDQDNQVQQQKQQAAQEQEEADDFEKQEEKRRKSEQKRVQLVVKDLMRLRLGFEQV